MPVNPPLLDEAVDTAEDQRRSRRRTVMAAFLSALIPGIGQLFLGQRRKGYILLGSLILLMVCFWPLRLPRFYPAFAILSWYYIGLCLYAAGSAIWTAPNPQSRRSSRWWLGAVVPVAIITLWVVGDAGTRAAGFRSFKIPSSSMEPTIREGDRIVADMRYYYSRVPQRLDIIVFKKGHRFFIKRVIGISGDFVSGKDGSVYVNGQALNEPYIQHAGRAPFWMNTFGPIPVSGGKVFVMGDNRDVSLDSRSSEYGLVDSNSIVGKPLYVLGSNRMGRALH